MELILKNVKKEDYPIFESLAKSLGFEILTKKEKPYDSESVREILEADQDLQNGKGRLLTLEEQEDLCR